MINALSFPKHTYEKIYPIIPFIIILELLNKFPISIYVQIDTHTLIRKPHKKPQLESTQKIIVSLLSV